LIKRTYFCQLLEEP